MHLEWWRHLEYMCTRESCSSGVETGLQLLHHFQHFTIWYESLTIKTCLCIFSGEVLQISFVPRYLAALCKTDYNFHHGKWAFQKCVMRSWVLWYLEPCLDPNPTPKYFWKVFYVPFTDLNTSQEPTSLALLLTLSTCKCFSTTFKSFIVLSFIQLLSGI